jgi:hypothetical protein
MAHLYPGDLNRYPGDLLRCQEEMARESMIKHMHSQFLVPPPLVKGQFLAQPEESKKLLLLEDLS